MPPHISISVLKKWTAQTATLFERALDYQTADNVRAIVQQYSAEAERQAIGRSGTLSDHVALRRTIRLADSVLDEIKEHNAVSLQGWSFGLPATNAAQNIYAVLYGLAQEMSFAKFGIEAEFPTMSAEFDRERREYASALASFKNED